MNLFLKCDSTSLVNSPISRNKGFKGTALDWLPVHPNNALYGPTKEAIRNYADAFNYYYVLPVRNEQSCNRSL